MIRQCVTRDRGGPWPRRFTAALPEAVPASPFYTEEHEAFRAHRPPLRRPRDHAPRRPVGRGRGVPARALPQGLGRRPAAARLSRGIWRRPDRSVLRHHQVRGDGAARQRRRQRQPEQPHHRLAADRGARAGMDEAQGPARGAGGREDQRARHHRAERRLRRRQPQDHGAARGRPLRRQRLQDVHHLGHARRLLHRRGAHRRAGRWRRVAAADRARPRGLRAHQAQEDGLVGVRHRAALLRQRARCRSRT